MTDFQYDFGFKRINLGNITEDDEHGSLGKKHLNHLWQVFFNVLLLPKGLYSHEGAVF